MSKEKSPSFAHEFQLITTSQTIKILDKRLDVARQIYNACLAEALKRLALMRESKRYMQAKAAPKKIKQRNALFKQALELYQFSEYDMHGYVKNLCKGAWLSEQIDSSTASQVKILNTNLENKSKTKMNLAKKQPLP